MAEASAAFARERIRLQDSLAKQLGVTATVKEFEELKDRHTETVIEAFESAASAILSATRDAARGRGTRSDRRK